MCSQASTEECYPESEWMKELKRQKCLEEAGQEEYSGTGQCCEMPMMKGCYLQFEGEVCVLSSTKGCWRGWQLKWECWC